jgi:hypothetical protein
MRLYQEQNIKPFDAHHGASWQKLFGVQRICKEFPKTLCSFNSR